MLADVQGAFNSIVDQGEGRSIDPLAVLALRTVTAPVHANNPQPDKGNDANFIINACIVVDAGMPCLRIVIV
jgi:hypothetical protein